MQRFIFENSSRKAGRQRGGLPFIQKHHRVRSRKALEAADHRILIYRDPLQRIKSLYTNKFVQRQGFEDIFRSYRKVTGLNPEKASFEEFVLQYVARLGELRLDPHVQPQSWHLCNVVYDQVIPLQSLQERMALIVGEQMAQNFFERKVNESLHVDIYISPDLSMRIKDIYMEDYLMIEKIK